MEPAPIASPESLLRIPFIADLLADASVRRCARAIDGGWLRDKQATMSVAGFQPFSSTLYHATRAPVAAWLAVPHESARRFNAFDGLIKDALFLAHDYLHILAVRAIRHHFPALSFGEEPARDLEAHVFCHLVTEAFATIGLDYWYLSTIELNDVVDIGTRRETLTVPYHERWLSEYRRFNGDLTVQSPAFFAELCRFYCTGELTGFAADDVPQSPLLAAWLTQELHYGERQRVIARQWFGYLAACDESDDAGRPVTVDRPWQQALIETLSAILWAYVKERRPNALPPLALPALQPPPFDARPVDFRFVNLCALEDGELAALVRSGRIEPRSFDLYFNQQLSRLDRAQFPVDRLARLPQLRQSQDFVAVNEAFAGLARVPGQADEPLHLMLIN
jgi:hypothetical protein